MVSLMANYSVSLDAIFHALGDPTRRAVVHRLMAGGASVTELAAPFDMALPSFLRHLGVLERIGLVTSRKVGRVRTCHIQPGCLADAEAWLAEQRALWEARTDRMVAYVERLNQEGNGS